MYTGRDAVFAVEQAIGRVRADETQLDATLRSAIEEAARWRREEGEGFRALARIKLDQMVRDEVVGELDAAERRALQMIESHRVALDDLAKRRAAAEAEVVGAEQEKHGKDQTLADALQALDRARAATAGRVGTDPAWQAAKAAADDAERIAQAADAKAATAEADHAEKRKPYEDDPLFMYLWRKKHGQAEDRSGPFVRFFDRRVARLVGYYEARPNYAMLNEIPLRLREHAKARLAEVEAAKGRLAEVERRALVADGVEPLEALVTQARAAAQAAAEAVGKANAALHQLDVDRERIVGAGDGAAYGGAIELLAQGLAREDLRGLYREAMRTPTPDDEAALDAISRARQELERADAEVAEIRKEIRGLAQRRGELEGARDRARQGGFDSPLGGFAAQAGGAILGQVIGAILAGSARGSDLDRVFRDNYRWREPQAPGDFGGGWLGGGDPWGGGGGGGSWGGGGGGGPWGGGGGGGGGDSGGGWKTGGSF